MDNTSCTVQNCTQCLQDEPNTWNHGPYDYYPFDTRACPLCGAWGAHNCLGYQPATTKIFPTSTPVDWNRAINILDRLVTLLEKHLGDQNG